MVRFRRGAAVVAAAAAVGSIALSGCENRTGAAGFVGKTPIETSQLSGYVQRGALAATNAQASVSPQDIQQSWLDTLIRTDLAERVAAEQGITLSQSDVTVFLNRFAPLAGGLDALTQKVAQGGVAAQDLPAYTREIALENAIADKVAPNVLAPDDYAHQAYDQFKADYAGLTYEQVGPLIRQVLVLDQRQQAVAPLLQAEARRVGVRVNPRFGTWNIDQLAVGAPPTDLARPAVTPAPPDVTSGESDSVPVAPSP